MQEITAQNVQDFAPTYHGYAHRRATTASMLGVESAVDLKDFRGPVEKINAESGIGLSTEEKNIIALMLTEEEANVRFNANKYIHPHFGGNTGEHPIFISHKVDAMRDAAGYGPTHFADLDPAHQLASARFFQRQHMKSLVHDAGELIDIAYSEQKATGASYKEPEEEALVGPFKISLAAYAINEHTPALYVSTMHEARERIKLVKQELYDKAIAGEITGDAFVAGVGKEIGRIVEETTQRLTGGKEKLDEALAPRYADAAKGLIEIFDSTQVKGGPVEQKIFDMFDKIEGDAHFRHFVGRMPAKPTEETALMERMFGGGKALSYHLASSSDVIAGITYSQKVIPAALTAAEDMPKGPQRDVALAVARQGSALLVRNYIRMLQKAPPVLDLTGADKETPAQSTQEEQQRQAFARRMDIVRDMKDSWLEKARNGERNFPVTRMEGTVDTKTLIAVLDKAAKAIENGSYVPRTLPIALGALPPQLQVTHSEMLESARRYPLEVATAYAQHGMAL